ncbi:peptidase S41 [Sphingomonas lacunae]|uniref:Peptidase S41 n=1 Tax=Sphingomonas lacunae TaxID=2698828 RepID=A0A6M4AQT7_9SPHN|nr:S41 family peptidase [Sphingomonas lacunae]QJQ31066.1 peptidase S41 [Sphingomonas lacunae]
MRKFVAYPVIASLLLTACGGGGTSSSGGTGGGSGGGSSGGTSTGCSLRERQDWALATLREWYLFPDELATNVNPGNHATVQDYIDALTAPARTSGKDRFFTYITSIQEENAFLASGSSAGFGIRLTYDNAARRVFITEAFEGAPALAAGIDRGDEIVAIGTSIATLRPVSEIMAAEGAGGVTNALGPSTAGTTRALRVSGPSGSRELTLAKADYSLSPVSNRYGARILDDGGKRIGYLNFRTFISAGDQQLRDAFASFRAQGITEFVIDLRYNGGGLVSTAGLFGDLLGGARSNADVFSRTTFRPEKSSSDSVDYFAPQSQSVSPVKIAFIGTGATASASELVINGMVPFFNSANLALIGGNTYGKPVGQVAIDRSACDDRLRVVAFATANGAGNAAYYNGLASSVGTSCRAADDYTLPLGDLREASIRQAVDFLGGRSCTAIAAGTGGDTAIAPGTPSGQFAVDAIISEPEPLIPARPTPAQREVPGLF